jgi:hypothetical protein
VEREAGGKKRIFAFLKNFSLQSEKNFGRFFCFYFAKKVTKVFLLEADKTRRNQRSGGF